MNPLTATLIPTPALLVEPSPESLPAPSASCDAPAPAQASVARLTRRLAAGDEAAFAEFHARYFDRLYQFHLVLSRGDEHAARAALQDTLLRVARHARAFESEDAFRDWLKVVARSAARDGGRKQRRYSLLMRNFSRQFGDAPARSAAPQEQEDHLRAMLEECLVELGPGERELLTGKYLRGATVRQLSGESGLTEKAVESRLLRLRRSLRERVLKRLREP